MTRAFDPKCPRPERTDLYTTVTNQIIADLERGVTPWTRPWSAAHRAGPVSRPLRHTLEPYSGINVLLLWSRSLVSGYSAPIWMTFRQALSLGGHVRRGEHGETVVYANRVVRTETGANGEDIETAIPFLKAYTVFNIAQIDGLPERFSDPAIDETNPDQRIARAEAFFGATGAVIRHGGDSAFYSPTADHVQMPPFERFHSAEAYYATLAHECTHWTGHPTRLDRDQSGRFGSPDYAREELVAELGAAFLCADLGLTLAPRDDHAAYIGHWLKALKDDRRLIFSAAAHAQKACDHLLALQASDA